MTNTHIHKQEFEWKIENFSISKIQKRGFIKSPVFVSKVLFDSSWYVYLDVDENFEQNHIGAYVHLIYNSKVPSSIKIGFDIGIIDVHGKERHTKSTIITNPKFLYSGHPKFVPRRDICEEFSQFLVKDTLTLKGKIWRYFPEDAVDKIMLRSTLDLTNIYMHIIANPLNISRSFRLVPKGIQCEFKLKFAWEMISSFELFFPTVTIQPMSNPKGWIFVSAKISYVNKNFKDVSTEGVRYFDDQWGDIWELVEFKRPMNFYFGESHLESMNFFCEFTFSDSEKENAQETLFTWSYDNSHQPELQLGGHVLPHRMKSVLNDLRFPDVHIKVGEVRIPAHRVILSARSPVFRHVLTEPNRNHGERFLLFLGQLLRRTRLQGEPKETYEQIELRKAVENSGLTASKVNGEWILTFSRAQASVVQSMVSFMYTDDISMVDVDTAIKLLYASDKYQIKGLKKWCWWYLKSNITIENANDILLNLNVLGWEMFRNAAFLFMYEHEELIRIYLEKTQTADKCEECLKFYYRIKQLHIS